MVAKMKGTFVERPKKQKKEEEPPETKKRKRGQANAARYIVTLFLCDQL